MGLWRWASAVAVLILLGAACKGSPTAAPPPFPSATPPSAAPTAVPTPAPPTPHPSARYGGTLTVLVDHLPAGLHVWDVQDPLVVTVLGPVYSQLLEIANDDATVAPDLAYHWEMGPAGTTYTFHLRPDARFHGGTQVTAQDVRFSLDYLRKSTALGQALLAQVTDISAPDGATVVITLAQPQASLLSYLALEAMAIVPASTSGGTPPGSGPFRLTGGADVRDLARNPNYYLPTRPYLDRVTFQAVSELDARVAALRSGQAHMLGLPDGLSADETNALGSAPGVALDRANSLTQYAFLMNNRFPPWSDARVRQAASWAIDRGAFAPLAQPLGRPGMLLAPGTYWTTNPLPPRDLSRSRQLLAEAGVAQPLKVQLMVPSGILMQEGAFLLKDQLAEAGIELEPLFHDDAFVRDTVGRSAYQTALLSLSAPVADPDYLLGRRYVTGGAESHTKYSSREADEVFQRQSLAADVTARRRLVAELEKRIMDDAPAVALWWQDMVVARSSQVHNFHLGTGQQTNLSFQDVWLE